MDSEHSVTNIITAMKAGDAEAARQLWQRYFAKLVELADRRLGNAPRRVADEEDVALSVFGKLCNGAAEGRFAGVTDRHDLWMLLAVMVKQKAVDLVRYHARQKRGGVELRGESVFQRLQPEDFMLGLQQIAADDPTPDLLVQMEEQCQQLLQRLPHDTMRSIATWRLSGYTNEEIATRLGISVRSVERKLGLIRECWTRALESDLDGP